MANLINALKTHPALWFLIPYSGLLIFLGLGDSVLQVDEGADTFVASTILKYGLPHHSDGINSTMPYADIYGGLFVYRTWVPYYLQALSLGFLGATSFAARLPFALAGMVSVAAQYFLTLKWTQKTSTAFLSAFLLASSVPALLYFRTARYVALPVLLTLLLLFFYTQILEKKNWNPVPFTLTAILFFHTMYVESAGIIVGILIHFLWHRENIARENFRKVWISGIVIALFTLPWLAVIVPVFSRISEFYHSTSGLIDSSATGFFKHFAGYLFQANNYIFPFILLPFLWLKSPRNLRKYVRLLMICSVSIFTVSSLHSIPLQQYVAAALPMLYILLAITLTDCVGGGCWVRSALAACLVVTNWVHVGPLLPVKHLLSPRPEWIEKSGYLRYAHQTFMREIRFTSVYYRHLYEITHPYRGPLDGIVEFFNTHRTPRATCYIDNEPESLAFHTGMKLIPNEELSDRDKPDWIVLRGDHLYLEREDPPSPVTLKLRKILHSHPYRKIRLNVPAWRINNSYDIQLHLFQSPRFADKVVIYQLGDSPS